MLTNNENFVECNSIGITESDCEGIKDRTLLGLKENIIQDDMLWGTVVFPGWKCEGIRVDNPDGKSIIFQVGTSDGTKIGLIDNTMISIADSSKLVN